MRTAAIDSSPIFENTVDPATFFSSWIEKESMG